MIPSRDAPPETLPEDARAWWGPLVDELQARGSLARVARHRLAIYCQLFAQWQRVTEFINREGQILTVRDDKGEVKNQSIAPEAVQQIKLTEALRRFDKEFGLLEAVKGGNDLGHLAALLTARMAGKPVSHN